MRGGWALRRWRIIVKRQECRFPVKGTHMETRSDLWSRATLGERASCQFGTRAGTVPRWFVFNAEPQRRRGRRGACEEVHRVPMCLYLPLLHWRIIVKRQECRFPVKGTHMETRSDLWSRASLGERASCPFGRVPRCASMLNGLEARSPKMPSAFRLIVRVIGTRPFFLEASASLRLCVKIQMRNLG